MTQWSAKWVSFAFLSVVFGIASGETGSREDLKLWWADLGSTDGVKAYRAIGQLVGDSAKAVPFLGDHVRPVANIPNDRVSQLIVSLGSDKFAVRDKAQRELEELQDLATEELVKTLGAGPTLEVRRRIELLLEKQELLKSPARLQALRAIEVLETIGTPEAMRVLQKLADGAPESQQTREAKASLQRLAKRVKPAF
jgi:hypothetical protein